MTLDLLDLKKNDWVKITNPMWDHPRRIFQILIIDAYSNTWGPSLTDFETIREATETEDFVCVELFLGLYDKKKRINEVGWFTLDELEPISPEQLMIDLLEGNC